MKKQITLFTLLLFSYASFGQEESSFIIKKRQFISGINLSALSNLEEMNSSLTVTNGFLFKNRISASLGLGLEGSRSGTQLPIFLESRYLLFNKKSHSPFVSVMAGYLQPLQKFYPMRAKGGFTTGVQIGYQNFFGEHVGISTSIGYRYSVQNYQDQFWYGYGYEFQILPYPYPVEYLSEQHRLEIKFALLLK